ncbi:MAG: flagellar protein [Lachnospiraceae bacterium]|nr:flagellar protein [Lachnospiraceae bacterium]
MAGPPICPECVKALEEKFQEVRKYVQQNGRVDMESICNDCNVDTAQVQQWIRQERLQFSNDSPIKVSCEKCGKMISSGRFCAECKDKMARQLNEAAGLGGVMTEAPRSEKRSSANRMRFLDN